MRTLFTHQKMLEERSITLCNNVQLCIDKRKKYRNTNENILVFILVLNYQSEMNK